MKNSLSFAHVPHKLILNLVISSCCFAHEHQRNGSCLIYNQRGVLVFFLFFVFVLFCVLCFVFFFFFFFFWGGGGAFFLPSFTQLIKGTVSRYF